MAERDAKQLILGYYDSLPSSDVNEEQRVALKYLRKNRLRVFPYPFQYNYDRNDVSVFQDEKLGLNYILFEDKRLYFRRGSKPKDIQRDYNYLLIEQDLNSPHRYLAHDFKVEDGDIMVDVGAAEGNLPLSVIEKVKKVYLFETDTNWIEALEATFAPWKDKVEIVNKFVSNKNEANLVSLDQFFKGKERFSFLKVDAEGAEADILNGAEGCISSTERLKIALCCYHKPNDEHVFKDHLEKRKFSVSFANGYMIFRENFVPPYLRRGVLRAVKSRA